MAIELMNFQIQAIGDLIVSMEHSNKKLITLKSPTGSGKTIILTHFIDEYVKGHPNMVFVWLTPGAGGLVEQSKEKMDFYIHGSSTKLLDDALTSDFSENDTCFINWERVTKKTNNAIRDSERDNLIDKIKKAKNSGLKFAVVIDESHQNNTIKSDDVINYFNPTKIIRTSATPIKNEQSILIDIKEEDVISEGLIKKMLVINEGFDDNIETNNGTHFLLDKALDMQKKLKNDYSKLGTDINPLIIIQVPNKDDLILDQIEIYLRSKGITYENKLLAVWLDKKKENLERIEDLNALPIVIIIKQAVATGWDCPRSQILVKLRESNETFEIQTIGRIRRMPEAKHYENDLLDSCYLYTFDKKFKQDVKISLGKGALNAVRIFLKKEYRDVKLKTQLKTDLTRLGDSKLALSVMKNYYMSTYSLSTNKENNKKIMAAKGYIFSNYIEKTTSKGSVSSLNENEFTHLNKVKFTEQLSTHDQGRDFHNKVGRLGIKLSLPYDPMGTIIRRLFNKDTKSNFKILNLEVKELYAFVINNFDKLLEDIRKALSDIDNEQQQLPIENITGKDILLPKEFLLTYDENNKVQKVYLKNVYTNYLSSSEPRSDSEKSFEQFCENNKNVEWFYKNGDKGQEYLAIVYKDSFGNQKSFYPDYVISVNGNLWIIETKGGFSKSGQSEDIDRFSPRKFIRLKEYLLENKLQGGFVRKDKRSNNLFICLEKYEDDINSEYWLLLEDVLK